MEQNVRDPYDFCRPYLLEDEYILWKGRPERGNIFRQGDWMVVIFAVMWLGFSLFWEFSALKSVMSGGGLSFFWLCGDCPLSPSDCIFCYGRLPADCLSAG